MSLMLPAFQSLTSKLPKWYVSLLLKRVSSKFQWIQHGEIDPWVILNHSQQILTPHKWPVAQPTHKLRCVYSGDLQNFLKKSPQKINQLTWLIFILWNSINFRGLDLLSSLPDFPTFFSSWDARPCLICFGSFALPLEESSCCSLTAREPLLELDVLEEWSCNMSSSATDSAMFSSHVLSKEEVLLSSDLFCFDVCV